MTKLGAPYWPLLLRGGTNSAPLNVERLRVHRPFEAAGFLTGTGFGTAQRRSSANPPIPKTVNECLSTVDSNKTSSRAVGRRGVAKEDQRSGIVRVRL